MIKRATSAFILTTVCLALSGCFTAPPQVISLDPNRGSTSVAADAPVQVVFDHPVDVSTVPGRFRVAPELAGCDLTTAFAARPGARCRIRWLTDQPGFVLEHQGAVFAPSTKYEFRLAAGVADRAGAVNSLDHRWELTSAPAPRVRRIDPGPGDTGVPTDRPLVINFDQAMSPGATATAVHLEPSVPETRVVPNVKDHSRFVVLPGRLLQAETTYRIRVTTGATDDHGQPLQVATEASFTTGAPSGSVHGAVLARRAGEQPSAVVLTDMVPLQPGDPIWTTTILTAERGPAGPAVAYLDAAVSPGSRWLAVIEAPPGMPAASEGRLRIVDLVRGGDRLVVDGAAFPGWSPDGSVLAFKRGPAVEVYDPGTDETSALPAGAPLVDRPRWTSGNGTLVLPVRRSSGREGIDLADVALSARYPLPGDSGSSSAPLISPDGAELVFRSAGAGGTSEVWVAGLGTAASSPRRLAADATPLGYADSSTIIAMAVAPGGTPGLVRINSVSGDETRLSGGPTAPELTSVAVSAITRRVAYVAPDARGIMEVYTVNVDGTGSTAVTSFEAATLEAFSVSFTEG